MFRAAVLGPILAFAAATFRFAIVPADALEPPSGPVILTVSGAISETNTPEGTAAFDIEMLHALPQGTIATSTPWTEGRREFSGPLGRALLDAVGATGTMMTVMALNDYSAEVPVEDFRAHPVILATSMDGKLMTVREKGPLFIIYPFDDEPDLYGEIYFGRSVWQIASIEVR
jgi:hypothetical protein